MKGFRSLSCVNVGLQDCVCGLEVGQPHHGFLDLLGCNISRAEAKEGILDARIGILAEWWCFCVWVIE